MSDQPFVFVDRSLGRKAVPRLLREAGVKLVTLAEHYGVPEDETIEDTTWIVDAAAQGWILFMKDARIRRRPAERAAIEASRTQCFCLSDGNLPSAAMAQRYIDNWAAIVRASVEPGPFLYSVRATGIVRLAIEASDSAPAH